MPVIRFTSQLDTINKWAVLRVPKDASAQLPSRGQVMVKGTINGFQFQTALEPDGNGSHWLNVDTSMQKAANVRPGDTAELAVESTKVWPEPTVPADVQASLNANPRVHELWADITPMARWEWIRWIGATNNQDTRARRIEVSWSKLTGGTRRPCCFNRSACCVPEVSKNGVLLDPPA